MVLRFLDAYMNLAHNFKQYNLIISDDGEANKSKSGSCIKFSLHPNSEHKKGWIRSSLDDPEEEYELLHEIYGPITANSLEIEMSSFMFLTSFSSSLGIITKEISDALLSHGQLVSSRKRRFLAQEIVSFARAIIAENAETISSGSNNIISPDVQIEILVELFTFTLIFIEDEEAAGMEEYKRCHRDTIPASITAVAALERRRFSDGSNDHDNPNTTCPICLEEYQQQQHQQEEEEEEEGGSLLTIIRMPCCHEFHANCITKWLQKGHDCPMCRFELPISLYEDML